MDSNPNQSAPSNGGIWPNLTSRGLQPFPANPDPNGGDSIIHGQDMTLLQRPLLESPSGSEASKDGDSIGESIQGDGIGDIPDPKSANNHESVLRQYGSAETTLSKVQSDRDNFGSMAPINETKNDHPNYCVGEIIVNNPEVKSDVITNLVRKRDRSTDFGAILDSSRTKKMRCESAFGTDLVDSDNVQKSVIKPTPRFDLLEGDLVMGKEVVDRLSEKGSVALAKNPADDGLTSSLTTAPYHCSSPGVFDDAEDDGTLQVGSIARGMVEEGSDPMIPADLVATILGSPVKPDPSGMPIFSASPVIAAVPLSPDAAKLESQGPKKAKMSKQVKRVWGSKKEQDAAKVILRGKVDLARVLSEDDCAFLGNHCNLFTLQQLEFILHEDMNAQDALVRLRLRQSLVDKLLELAVLERGDSVSSEKLLTGNSSGNIDLPGANNAAPKIEEDFLGTEAEEAKNAHKRTKEESGLEAPVDAPGEVISSLPAEKMREWNERIQVWRQTSSSESDVGQFSLSGALSQFIPPGTKRFFQSIDLKDAMDFLSLKKTETGLVVDLLQAWRTRCGLKQVPSLALAKHLLGIQTRIEIALTQIGGIDAKDIQWIADPIVVLTGAAKDFVIDECKIYSAERFVEMRTKYLADKLEDWRARKGLPILKGSGKVAMVSAWKALLKDEIEITNTVGKVIPENELKQEAESYLNLDPDLRKLKPIAEDDRPKKKVSKEVMALYSTPAAREALTSESFFCEIFGEDEKNMRMFKSVGITTAQHLFDADKGQNSDFLKAVVAMKVAQNGSVQASSCIRLLYNWAAKVRAKLDEVEQGKIIESSKRTKESSILDKAEKPKTSQRDRKSMSSDPFDALSSSSKDFLASMGITTAEQFLSTRTTDIANAFIAWRAEKKKSTLKGLGAVASVSGWKKLVRNKAALLGDEDLVQLNQASNSKHPFNARDKEPSRTNDTSSFSIEPSQNKSSTGGGPGRRKLAALSVGKDVVFHFELDLRSDSQNQKRFYLTYMGSDPASKILGCSSHRNKQEMLTGGGSESKEIMVDLGDVSAPISGRHPYESETYGLVQLGGLEVGLLEIENDRKLFLEECISDFLRVSSNSQSGLQKMALSSVCASAYSKWCNVFETIHNGKTARFLFLPEPIQKGQSVELSFLPTTLEKNSALGLDTRLIINESIRMLSLEELLAVYDSMSKIMVDPIDEQIKNILSHDRVDENKSSRFSSDMLKLIKARRRVHWIVKKIHSSIACLSGPDVDNSKYAHMKRHFWDDPLLALVRRLPSWSVDILRTEVLEEMEHEMMLLDDVRAFTESKNMWCPLAWDVFNCSMEIVTGFLVDFDSFCTKDDVVKNLCLIVSKAVKELQAAEGTMDADPFKLDKFALQYSHTPKEPSISTLLPSRKEVIEEVWGQSYDDALQLCGEPKHNLYREEDLRFVAIRKRTGGLGWKTAADAEMKKDKLNIEWYVEQQVVPAVAAVIRCGGAALEGEPQNIRFGEAQVIEAARIALGDSCLTISPFEASHQKKQSLVIPPSFTGDIHGRSIYQPHSSPFFHGFIWPILHDSGWKLVAGDTPLDVVYCPPSASKDKNRVGRMKEKIVRQRAQLAKDTSNTGFGYIPKVTKRLLIKCTEDVNDDHGSPGGTVVPCDVSAGSAIEMFQSSLVQRLTEEGIAVSEDACQKVIDITSEIAGLFDEIAPSVVFGEEDIEWGKEEKWRDVLGCQHLLRFLLLLPVTLVEANIPVGNQEQVLCIARELTAFISQNYEEFFDGILELPPEVYDDEPALPSNLYERICNACHLGDGAQAAVQDGIGKQPSFLCGESAEIVQSNDRGVLTDFLTCVMDQMIISRATEEDVLRKNRRFSAGHPCIVCRHCLGRQGEGKYFFGSNESLSASATVIEKHLLRCTKLEQTVKDKLIASRAKHSEQRKGLPLGAQGVFFAHLFDRLQSLRPSDGSDSEAYIAPLTMEKILQTRGSYASEFRNPSYNSDVDDGFKSHIDVMEFLQSSQPWISMESLQEAIEKYYNCLEYGGKIVNTSKSPLNFSSEWLYAKIAPSQDRDDR